MSELFSTNEEVTLDAFDFEVLNRHEGATPGATPLPRTFSRQARRAVARRRHARSEAVTALAPTELLLSEQRRFGASLESQLR
jgi:hypothetical protein